MKADSALSAHNLTKEHFISTAAQTNSRHCNVGNEHISKNDHVSKNTIRLGEKSFKWDFLILQPQSEI